MAFPPNVLKWRELLANASAIAGVVIAIPRGKPLPIPKKKRGISFHMILTTSVNVSQPIWQIF
jgi:hypothetical protein